MIDVDVLFTKFYLFGFCRKYVCICIVLFFSLFWCRREAEEAGGVALALSHHHHHHHHLLIKESWRRKMEEIVIRKNRLDPDMLVYETEVVNEMLQISTFFCSRRALLIFWLPF